MEYLMTYGWSILIIAVVMAVLFEFGSFGGSPINTACVPQTGYICQSPVLHSTTLTFTEVGQASATGWIGVNLLWVPQGQTVPINSGTYSWCPSSASNTVNGGISCYTVTNANGALGVEQPVAATFTFSSATTVGAGYSGALWAEYQISGGTSVYEVQMAKITLKAT
jgi:hypothetical protein